MNTRGRTSCATQDWTQWHTVAYTFTMIRCGEINVLVAETEKEDTI